MNNEKKTRPIVYARSGGDCELRLDGCLGRGHSIHHRRKRSQGGPWSPSNSIHTCGDGSRGCHGVITDTRTEYYDKGWLVHSWTDWAPTPVLLHTSKGHTYVLLDDEGGFRLVEWPDELDEHPDDLPSLRTLDVDGAA